MSKARKFGVKIVGDIPWGTHLCQFYDSKQDLIDILVPYFAEGLRSNEFCMWVTSEPLEVAEAKEALRKAIPNLDEYFGKGQIEIVSYKDWYIQNGKFDANRVLRGWVKKEEDALKRGFEGLRLTGNTFWVERSLWASFVDYEEAINAVIGQHKMLALCTYCLKNIAGSEVLDVVRNHIGTLLKQGRKWVLVEDAIQRKKEEQELWKAKNDWERTFDSVPDMIAVLDKQHKIVHVNRAMAEQLGLNPGECIGLQCFKCVHGTDMPPEFCPHSKTLSDSKEHVAEVYEPRLGGYFLVSTTPLRDEKGQLIGSVHVARNITERKQAEEALRQSEMKFRTVANFTYDWEYWITPDGSIAYMSPSCKKLTGYEAEEFIQDPKLLTKIIHADDKAAFASHLELSSLDKEHQMDLRIVTKTNKVRWISHVCQPVFDDEEKWVGRRVSNRDITERKRAEEALRENESLSAASQYTRSLIEASLDPLVTISADGKITDVNKATEEATGHSRQELIGSDFSDYFTEPEQARKGYRQAFTEGFVRDYPLALKHRTGKVTDVLYNATVYKNDRGEVKGVFAAARDVTERKQAEEKLRAASLYARSLIEASLDPLVTIDADGKITDVNEATEDVTGYSRQQLVGSDFSDYFTEPERAKAGYQQVFSEGFVRDYPLAIRHQNGKITEVLYNATLYRNEDGSIGGVFAAARDVTERRQAEEKARAASLYARNLIEASLDPLVTISADGKITDVNRATEEVTGFSRELLIGSDFSDYFTEPEQARKGYKQVFTDGYVKDYPLAIRHKSGKITDVIYNATLFKNAEGRIQGVFAAARDITERKAMEEKLRQSNAELEQFAYVASHDLQEPLRMVASYVQLLERRYKGKLDSDADEFIAYAVDGANRMRRLIDDLLTYSRVSRLGKPFEPTDLESTLEIVLSNLQASIMETNAVVTHDKLPTIIGDSGQMVQLFQNLIGNAIKFHGKETPRVSISVKVQDVNYLFAINDNGIGIESQYFDRLFKIFQRLHTKEEYPGSGIGLVICKKIVERHGGRIWIESQVGKGSTIYFTLKKT